MDRRVVAQLLDCIDQVSKLGDPSLEREEGGDRETEEGEEGKETGTGRGRQGKHVVLLCASNKPDSLDPAVRGRLSRELTLPVPDAVSRTAILALLTRRMKLLKGAIQGSETGSTASVDTHTGSVGSMGGHTEAMKALLAVGGAVDLVELGKATPG